ncbi:MAG TPA: DUF4403 family protein [Rhizomicrobium sp.]|nr:DUF4403 family protein [Rhizomicrobium sp.]
MRRRLVFPAFAGLALLLSGCGFEAPAPQRTPAPAAPAVPVSTLSATLTVPAAQLARLLGNMTEYQIADVKNQPIKCGPLQCHLDLHAERAGQLAVAVENGTLGIRMPFQVKAALSTSGFLSLHGQAEGTGMAVAHTGVTVSPRLALRSSADGTVTLDNGHLRIGPLVTNIAQVWNDNQESLSRPLWRSIDRQIARLPLRPRVAQVWADLFKPIKIGKSPASWLVLRPERLGVSQPRLADGSITLSIALAARARAVVRDTAPGNAPTPLPTAQIVTVPSRDFAFHVPLLLPYDQASRLALESLTRRPPKAGGMRVTFSKLRILPSGQDVVVATRFCADPSWDPFGWFASCGDVYLRGVPVFDSVEKTIRVDHLHYDVASANLMLSALKALAGDELTNLLQTHLVFHESNQIDRLEKQVTQLLARPQGRDLSVSAKVESFGAPSFTWTADGFLAVFSAKGQVEARLNL